MKKLLHPSYGLLIIELILFLGFVDVVLIVTSIFPNLRNAAFLVPSSIFLCLYAIYLLYVLIDFAIRFLRPIGTFKELIYKYRKDKRFRRICNSYVGSIVNLAMAVWYISYAYIRGSLFYGMASQYLFFGFIGRIYLLYNFFNDKKDKEKTGFLVSSILTLFLGTAMQAITLVCILTEVTVLKSEIMTLAVTTYTFAKFIAAIVSLRSSIKEHDIQLLSFCIISMALAFYSMFMLVITMPVTFGDISIEHSQDFTYFGFLFAAIIMIIAICCLIYYHKIKNKAPVSKNETITRDDLNNTPIVLEDEKPEAALFTNQQERGQEYENEN